MGTFPLIFFGKVNTHFITCLHSQPTGLLSGWYGARSTFMVKTILRCVSLLSSFNSMFWFYLISTAAFSDIYMLAVMFLAVTAASVIIVYLSLLSSSCPNIVSFLLFQIIQQLEGACPCLDTFLIGISPCSLAFVMSGRPIYMGLPVILY